MTFLVKICRLLYETGFYTRRVFLCMSTLKPGLYTLGFVWRRAMSCPVVCPIARSVELRRAMSCPVVCPIARSVDLCRKSTCTLSLKIGSQCAKPGSSWRMVAEFGLYCILNVYVERYIFKRVVFPTLS